MLFTLKGGSWDVEKKKRGEPKPLTKKGNIFGIPVLEVLEGDTHTGELWEEGCGKRGRRKEGGSVTKTKTLECGIQLGVTGKRRGGDDEKSKWTGAGGFVKGQRALKRDGRGKKMGCVVGSNVKRVINTEIHGKNQGTEEALVGLA